MACSQYWNSPYFVGSHRIAKVLAKGGWKVAFLSFPVSVPHLLRFPREAHLGKRLKIYLNGGLEDYQGNLWAYVPGTLCAPYNLPVMNSNWIINNWQNLTFPNVIDKLKKRGFNNVDVIYFDNPFHNYLLDAITHGISLYRIADDLSQFPYYCNAVDTAEHTLVDRVNRIIYPSSSLVERVPSTYRSKCRYFPNGVIYNDINRGNAGLPEEYKRIQGPIAIFVGAMPAWFDYELINYTARELPQVSFVLIGDGPMAARLKGKNIYLLGAKVNQDIPGYIMHADVGLLPFNVSNYPKLVNGLNPLKMYEYFSAGLPVVATDWDEIKRSNAPVYRAASKPQYVEMMKKALDEKGDGGKYRNYAIENDWAVKIPKLFDELQSL